MASTRTTAKAFHGPPESGNGGYVCGCQARFIGGPRVVGLKASPPLKRPLTVENDGAEVRLTEQGRTGAQTRPTAFDLEIPAPPTLDEACTASGGYSGFRPLDALLFCLQTGAQRGVGAGHLCRTASQPRHGGRPQDTAHRAGRS